MANFFGNLFGKRSESQHKTKSEPRDTKQHDNGGSVSQGQDVPIIPIQQIILLEIIFKKDKWAETEKQWLRDGYEQVLKLFWPEIMAAFQNLNPSPSLRIKFAALEKWKCQPKIDHL